MRVEYVPGEIVQLCGFRIGSDFYAIPVLDVQEVIKPQNVTIVPLSNPEIKGLINLRGQIVTLIGLRKIFQLDDDLTAPYMNIIVKNGESLYSMVVDEVLDVMEVDGVCYEETPDALDVRVKPYINGVLKLKNRILILLDINKIIQNDESERRTNESLS